MVPRDGRRRGEREKKTEKKKKKKKQSFVRVSRWWLGTCEEAQKETI